jgi:hypothetical protein
MRSFVLALLAVAPLALADRLAVPRPALHCVRATVASPLPPLLRLRGGEEGKQVPRRRAAAEIAFAISPRSPLHNHHSHRRLSTRRSLSKRSRARR